MIATDVAARGLDVKECMCVINYDFPMQIEDYVHRVGRAGHGGGFGESFSLISHREEERWPKFRSVAGGKVEVMDPRECDQWLRPVDLERITRTRGGTKALNQLKLRQSASESSEDRFRDRGRKSGRPDGERGHFGQKKRKKSGSRELKFGARGNAARRSKKQKPIGKNQKPGGGVRRPSQD